jgi:hypothetical protein
MMPRYRKLSPKQITYGNNCPYIDIQYESGRMFISNAVFRLIGNPTGIRFLWNSVKCVIIIEPTTIENPEGFPIIGEQYRKDRSMFIGCCSFMDKIWKTIDWDKMLRYRIVAKYNVPTNTAEFELDGAVAFDIPRKKIGRPRKIQLE